jgi:hypothetical protein
VAQAAIVAAGLAQEGIALGGIAVQRLVEDFLNLLPSFQSLLQTRLPIQNHSKRSRGPLH